MSAPEAKPGPDGQLNPWLVELRVLVCAALGGLLFYRLGIPAAWLSGGMAGAVALQLVVKDVSLRKPWFDLTMLLSGCLIGAAATPEAIAAAARYPGSIAILCVGMLAIMAATTFFLQRVAGWSRLDAVLASAPGAFSAVVAIAIDRGGNVPRIAAIQMFRLLVLVAVLPSLMSLMGGTGVRAPVTLAVGPGAMAVMLAACFAVGLLFEKLGVMAPIIIGATLASAALHGTGLVHGTLPDGIAILAFVILGATISGRLSSLDAQTARQLLPLALGGFAVSMGVAMLFAWPAAIVANVPYVTALAAFAPGGLEALAMLALALGLDPLYVGAHHLVRFVAIGLLLPVVVRLVVPRGSDSGIDRGEG
ncbi:MAG: AbrB family transcriptional regulator [Bosea sp. (in: a-proteobacteria)]